MSKNLSDYQKGACPVAEELHAKTYFSIPICYYEYTIKDILRIIKSFKKVWKKCLDGCKSSKFKNTYPK